MKKRILAFLVLLTMLVGVVALMVMTAKPQKFDVGYAKVDINPYADGTGEDQELMAIPMAGGGQTTTRLSTGKLDDNGDGQIDENDGIFATCVAITDHNGKTVLLISCDLNNTFAPFFDPARQKILEKFADQGVEVDRILVNASHTHSGPLLTARYSSGFAFTDDYNAYKERLINQIVKVAELALLDRAPATMYKGEIDASESKAASDGIVGDTMNKLLRTESQVTPVTVSGERSYNGVRHYQITMESTSGEKFTYVCGDNFNQFRIEGASVTENGTMYTVTETKEVSVADDTMQIVKFEFEDEAKRPIALINWRAHAAIAKGTTEAAYYKISGDFVNSLRYTLESGIVSQQKYRTAYFQGAAGNINPGTKLQSGLWLQIGNAGHRQDRHNIYGTELAEVALECLENNMQPINQNGGEIRSAYDFYQTQRRQVSIYEYAAGQQYKNEYDNTQGGISGNRTYKNDAYHLDKNGQPTINPVTGLPYLAVDDEAKEKDYGSVTIASIFHANSVIDGYKNNDVPGLKMDLHAITIGEDFSLISAGGEFFDRYSQSGDLSENMWDDVDVDFVLGYTNTCGSYLSSTATYEFNKENESMAMGSYETMSTSFEKGVGETILLHTNDMLTSLREEKAGDDAK